MPLVTILSILKAESHFNLTRKKRLRQKPQESRSRTRPYQTMASEAGANAARVPK